MAGRPAGLPNHWLSMGWHGEAAVFDRVDGRRALYSIENHGKWEHLSLSRPDRLPSWDELREAKNEFFGRQAMAVQILPPESEYVNLHPYVLHLWRFLGGPNWPMEKTT